MQYTPYSDVNEVLELLLLNLKKVLGDKLMGLYLYGSLLTGDFDIEISDIDLLAVTSTDIDDNEFSALNKMHKDFVKEYKKWNDRIEIAYVSKDALKTFKTKKSQIAIISPGEPFHRKVAGNDWLINWYMVRGKGITLFGPTPTTLITLISKEEFIRANREQTKEWREWVHNDHKLGFQAYAILTMCRALHVYRHGEQISKKQAAIWAQKELPQWSSLIQNALVWRRDKENKRVDEKTFPVTVKFVHFVIDQIVN